MAADIYVFGDSIGYGAVDEKGGWVDRLKQYFHAQRLAGSELTEVYNLSVDGDTAKDVADRIENELAVRRKSWSTQSDLVVVAVGGNDSCAEGTPEDYWFSTEEYSENLSKIHEIISKFGLRVVFVGPTATDDSKTNPCRWGAYYFSNNRVKEFDLTQAEFCRENNIPRVELFDKTLGEEYQKNLYDGLHPNSKGHEWLYEQVKPIVTAIIEDEV